jgi:hypothetical protein
MLGNNAKGYNISFAAQRHLSAIKIKKLQIVDSADNFSNQDEPDMYKVQTCFANPLRK